MIPDLPLAIATTVWATARWAAPPGYWTDPECFERVDHIRDGITYLELNVNQDFMNRFSAAKFLPHTDTSPVPVGSCRPMDRPPIRRNRDKHIQGLWPVPEKMAVLAALNRLS